MEESPRTAALYLRSDPLKMVSRIFVADKVLLALRIVVVYLIWSLYDDATCEIYSVPQLAPALMFSIWCTITSVTLLHFQGSIHYHMDTTLRRQYANGMVASQSAHVILTLAFVLYFGRHCLATWSHPDPTGFFFFALLCGTIMLLLDFAYYLSYSVCEVAEVETRYVYAQLT